ncbi:plasmid pRiA4b ORF-3 family protein [Sanyastnella coralliicola]|uniref:plasmid pRiA4b ORF-3 family protein n=1 Tax=Sanyastnella coralliicola TaxID=3069118 RepID=UPI0027B923BB|nr:plasmid pRiA4b ORF-3 family protein [Longitalea sp. SCSIO 12813]
MIFELLIELDSLEPRVWRRVRVNSDIDMRTLHHTIQLAMGWENCHLYYFATAVEKISQLEFLEDEDFVEDHEVNLDEFVQSAGDKINYVYDFGDKWSHTITLEKIVENDESEHIPICLAGERNCPPEDVGGISGYHEFLKIMSNPRLPEYEEKVDWYGGEYDPAQFRMSVINEDLEEIDDYIDSLDEDWLY